MIPARRLARRVYAHLALPVWLAAWRLRVSGWPRRTPLLLSADEALAALGVRVRRINDQAAVDAADRLSEGD